MTAALDQARTYMLSMGFRIGPARAIFKADPTREDCLVLHVLDGGGRLIAEQCMQLVMASGTTWIGDESAHGREPLVVYPGRRRHPQGSGAVHSWINAVGDGAIAILSDRLVLTGALESTGPTHGIALVEEQRRGRPNDSAFWCAVAAIANAIGFSTHTLKDITRFSNYPITTWLADAQKMGWTRHVHEQRRLRAYALTHNGVLSLAEYIASRWHEYRSGERRRRLNYACERRYFIANARVETYEQGTDHPVVPTGITALEKTSLLMATGPIREVALLTTAAGAGELIDKFHIRLMDKRDIPGASEIDIVPDDHPYLRIISMRKVDRTTPVWPLGFAALDAFDHPNPRVARAAKEVWNQWIANLVDPQSGSGHG